MKLTATTTAIILVAGLTESLLGILQVAGIAASGHSLYAATGTFYNPGPYGAFLGVVVPVALWCILTCGNRYMSWRQKGAQADNMAEGYSDAEAVTCR
ncbi:MAG: hypothetical protein K2O27_03210 [Candidatus Amulumruptor sp.]|nr:hypothetical protein [Candidatus Amulumruptor sp.]MDE7151250.1 hypothetical protein [Candidatus Amulumruptor sp.]